MIPAQTPLAKTAAVPPTRFTAIFVPHGMAPGYWVPEKVGTGFEFTPIMKPLEPFREYTNILSGMWSQSAEPPPGVTGADHWVAAAFLCADKPKKTAGADIRDGVTIDQLIAQKIGQDNLMPSLQLGVEDPGANSSNCGEGYSCAYTNSISWMTPTKPLPMEINPQVVFERLFGAGGSTAERTARREEDRSMLDRSCSTRAASRRTSAPSDRHRVDEYLEDVREIERRLEIARKASATIPTMETPYGVPIVLRRTHQAAIRSAGAGVPGRHHARFDHSLCARSHRPRLSRKAAPPPVSTAPRTTPRIPRTFSITRRSTPIT